MDDTSTVFVNEMIRTALEHNSPDIHVYAEAELLEVKLRRHRTLEIYSQMKHEGFSVIRRIKALAKMDTVPLHQPKDGAFHWEMEGFHRACDVRVAIAPTIHGEAAVLRLLLREHSTLTLVELGMNPHQAAQIQKILQHETGLLLVSGPTGSGKTTTLYAMMRALADMGKQVISIEDPVESIVAGCQQMEVSDGFGMTYSVGLRAMLRHDPDVLVVGEIRDVDSARAALQAALSGHLVLTTTHAKGVIGSASRLQEFGFSKRLVADVLLGVIVQEYSSQLIDSDTTPVSASTHLQFNAMSDELRHRVASNAAWSNMRQLNAKMVQP